MKAVMTKDDASSKHPSPGRTGPQEQQAPQYSFVITPEMQTYISYKQTAGLEVHLKTEFQQRAFLKEFQAWQKRGCPKPKMPDIYTDEDPIPMKLYRIKYMGKQKIYWYDTKANLHGKVDDSVPVLERVTNATTKETHDVEVGRVEGFNYTIDFTKETGTKMVEDALDRCVNPTFYIIFGKSKWQVGPSAFLGDFDELTERIKKKQYDAELDIQGQTDKTVGGPQMPQK
jgi:hypothetical protein